jgi:hypothetical protein
LLRRLCDTLNVQADLGELFVAFGVEHNGQAGRAAGRESWETRLIGRLDTAGPKRPSGSLLDHQAKPL